MAWQQMHMIRQDRQSQSTKEVSQMQQMVLPTKQTCQQIQPMDGLHQWIPAHQEQPREQS